MMFCHVLLNLLTAKKLRGQLRKELRQTYWQDPESLKTPWEKHLSTEYRPLRSLVCLDNNDVDVELNTEQIAFDHEMDVCGVHQN